ncbi:MAG: N-acetylmuramoyl-L-alanine amidase [Myxococcota bacterium]|nr:N-acetylmuramoyl-L-alanine amidase [Myxococcota bacterium]
MPPYVDDELKVSENAWEDGQSNDIIILGKRVKLVKSDDSDFKRVINYLDDASLDFTRAAFQKGLPFSPVRPRKGKPSSIEDLKKTIKFTVIHTDLTEHARKTFAVLLGRQPTPLSTHFCINWNGIIYQYADVADRTAHAGETNNESVGIDMNLMMTNLGRTSKRKRIAAFDRLRAAYRNLAREKLQAKGLSGLKLKKALSKYEFEKPRSLKIQNSRIRAWGYTPIQYESLILLLKLFVRELDMKKTYPMTPDGKVIPHLLADEDTKKLHGFIGHWHLDDQRWDPGPAFDWERVLSGLQNEYNWFPLAWNEDMILQGRDIAKAAEAAHELTRNSETARQGGTYPIGPNQTWHGGVHLYPPQPEPGRKKRYPVHAMFDGVVVAAHFEEQARDLGHNNFVLLKHRIEIPKRSAKLNDDGTLPTDNLEFFTLYMHLDSMGQLTQDAGERLADRYEKLTWVKRLYEFERAQKNEDPKSEDLGRALKEYVAQRQAERDSIRKKLDAGESIDAERRALIVDLDEDVAEDILRKSSNYLTVGEGTANLIDPNKVALLANQEGEGIEVLAGEWLGFTGLLPDRDNEDEWVVGVHVEVFCTEEMVELIDLDRHAEYFRTPQRARSADLTVTTEDILMIFRDASRVKPYRNIKLWPDERIAPDDIIDFFAAESRREDDANEAYREQLRRSITYHISEWSDQVDWVASLTGGQSWSRAVSDSDFRALVNQSGLFSDEVKKFLPYMWLTSDVANGVGLADGGWDGRLYHFHPIHWVMWVTYHASSRDRTYFTPTSLRQLIVRQRRAKGIRNLVEAGREAHESGSAKSWRKWQRKRERVLAKRPFRFTKQRLKQKKLREEYDALIARIDNMVFEGVDDDHGSEFGVIEGAPSLYSNPKEVLDDLFQLPNRFEWEVDRDDT